MLIAQRSPKHPTMPRLLLALLPLALASFPAPPEQTKEQLSSLPASKGMGHASTVALIKIGMTAVLTRKFVMVIL